MKLHALAALVLLPVLAACASTADTIYINGVIHTVDDANPRAEAIAVRADRIVAVGSARALLGEHRGDGTEVVDLGGACVVPGLIDAHGHLSNLGAMRLRLDLRETRNLDEVVVLAEERASRTPWGEWIVGRGWDQASWGEKEFPVHDRLSAATPDHPVFLTRVDGHAVLVNQGALEVAGIGRDTPDPPGGEILRDASGWPTGILVDEAIELVRDHMPDDDGSAVAERWVAAQEACFRVGLTGVHDAGVDHPHVEALRGLYDAGVMKLRAHAMLSGGEDGIDEYLRDHPPRRDPSFSVRAVKLYMDGSMGSRGAWLLADYADRPGHRGLSTTKPERIRELVDLAVARGYQVCIHAIGDRGNREALDAYAAAIARQPGADARLRIEHAQCVHLDDIPRFAELGVIASMQPTHATSDMRWAQDRVGRKRLAGCYAWRLLLDSGARLAFGSDFPVESENPLWGMYSTVTRQDHEGRPADGWLPDQKLTAAEALRLFTLDAAYAAFREHDLGSLEPGKLADFVVLDRDVLAAPPKEMLTTRVLRTVVGGETVYEADAPTR